MKPENRYVLPTSGDDEDQFAKKKQALLGKLLPTSVVPAATSNAFLVVGSRNADECYDPSLNKFLLFAGTVSIGMGVLGSVFRYVLESILSDKKITRSEFCLIRLMDILSSSIVVVEFGLLVGATYVFYPFIFKGEWQSEDPSKPKYCNYGTVVFSSIFISACWLLFALTGIIYLIIQTNARKYKKKT